MGDEGSLMGARGTLSVFTGATLRKRDVGISRREVGAAVAGGEGEGEPLLLPGSESVLAVSPAAAAAAPAAASSSSSSSLAPNRSGAESCMGVGGVLRITRWEGMLSEERAEALGAS